MKKCCVCDRKFKTPGGYKTCKACGAVLCVNYKANCRDIHAARDCSGAKETA